MHEPSKSDTWAVLRAGLHGADPVRGPRGETVTGYIVDLRCPKCGKVHRASNHFQLDDGPTEPGSLADLYGAGDLPSALVSLLHDLVWCPVTQRRVNQKDRARVYLMPKQR
ncbi:hypothetical protein ACFLT5_01980 [Chloroflexota bacterium]